MITNIFYCHFEEYEIDETLKTKNRKKTDELERELNRIVQNIMDKSEFELLNPYIGSSISNSVKN